MKKYLLISEVETLLGISQTALRYLEKTNPKIKISKIRGRRYYKFDDLEKIALATGATFDSASLKMGHPIKKIEKEPNMPDVQVDMFSVLEKIKRKSIERQNNDIDLQALRQQLINTKERLAKLLE